MKNLKRRSTLGWMLVLSFLVFGCQVTPELEKANATVQSWDETQPIATISGTTVTVLASQEELIALVAVGLDQGSTLNSAGISADFDNEFFYIEAIGADVESRVLTSAMVLIRIGDGLYVPGTANREVHSCVSHCDLNCRLKTGANNVVLGCKCGDAAVDGFCNHEVIVYTDK